MFRPRLTAVSIGCALLTLGTYAQPSTPSLFNDESVLTFTLEAPLQDLFDRGIKDDSVTVPATVSIEGREKPLGAATLAVRGNTSRQQTECSFPKLKLKFAKDADAGPFEGLGAIKINGHCGESEGDDLTEKFGRLANQRSPWREGVVYRILAATGVHTPRARLARITYRDTSSGGTIVPSPLTRNALLIEDDGDVKKRLGATGEITPDAFTNAQEIFRPEDSARVAFAQALIGNFDWCLMFSADDRYRCDQQKKLWNMAALRTADGVVPVMEDFDLAGPVTGSHVWFDHVYGSVFDESSVFTEITAQVQRTRVLFPRAVLDKMRDDLILRRSAIYRAIGTGQDDPHGGQLARRYVDAFFNQIENDAVFYRPVVVKPGARLYTSAIGTKEVCGRGDTMPVGTPVHQIGAQNGRAQVLVLDNMWRWAPPNECEPVHKGPVWIDAGVIGTDLPPRTR